MAHKAVNFYRHKLHRAARPAQPAGHPASRPQVSGAPQPASAGPNAAAPATSTAQRNKLSHWLHSWLGQTDAPPAETAPGVRFEDLKVGDELEGTVINLTGFGAFIDLDPLVGMVHISDLAWRRCKHPSEIVALGDRVRVCVLRLDSRKKRVSLGMKQLQPDPWINLATHCPPGTRLPGRVTDLTDFGAFVQIAPEVSGLVHKSEISWFAPHLPPASCLAPGQEVQVHILEVDEAGHRLSLSIKRCTPNPWEEFARKHPRGTRVQGKVKGVNGLGLFIHLPDGMDGLVHYSDLPPLPDDQPVWNFYQQDDPVEAVVLHVDVAQEHITLGMKQLAAQDTAG